MAPFDAPALVAAQIEIKKINAAGGVHGRPLKLVSINDQLDPQRTKQAAVQLLGQGPTSAGSRATSTTRRPRRRSS